MRFSRQHHYTIICEDRQTMHFLRNILEEQGINTRSINPIISDYGKGSGEAFVKREYPK